MAPSLFESDRTFRVWLYATSHRVLLIRSVASGDSRSRIDVLFKQVSFLCLPTEITALAIRIANDEADSLVVGRGALYSLSRTDRRICVRAGSVAWHEDTESDSAPSYFSLPRLVWD